LKQNIDFELHASYTCPPFSYLKLTINLVISFFLGFITGEIVGTYIYFVLLHKKYFKLERYHPNKSNVGDGIQQHIS